MKTSLFLSVFFFFSFFVQAQNIDSLGVVRQVDSLIQVAYRLLDIGQGEEALITAKQRVINNFP